MANAAQLTRVDRKYLVDRETVTVLLDRLSASFRVLTIEGRASTTYRSTYFDTAELASCRAHLQRRRRRWKLRSRLYVEDRLCRIEVKTKDGRGNTVKRMSDVEAATYGRLADHAGTFVRNVLGLEGITLDLRTLRPTVEVGYRRATLADTSSHERVTFDWAVASTFEGRRVWLDEACVLVETKGGPRPSAMDRLLTDLGCRPQSFSKYVSAACVIRDDLPDNDIRRLRGQLLHTGPLHATEEPVTA